MPSFEDQPGRRPDRSEPFYPTPLPPDLAEFLREKAYACLTEATDQGTVFVIKAPGADIQSMRGRVPVHVCHELYQHPSAPVIRTVLTIYDQPETPLALETFVNIDDAQQRSEFAALAEQERLLLLFYDEALAHRLTKVVPQANTETISQIVSEADRLFGEMDSSTYDFDQAKAAVIAATTV